MAQNETFERDYLIPKDQYNPDDHERQNNDVRQQAIQQGWHPTGDVEFVGAEMHGAVTVRLKYRVPVVLASQAEEFTERHVRVDQDAQEALEEAAKGDKTLEEADAELAERQNEAVRSRSHDEEPTPVPDDLPEGKGVNTGPSEPAKEEGEKPPPRKLHEDSKPKRTAKKAASKDNDEKKGDA